MSWLLLEDSAMLSAYIRTYAFDSSLIAFTTSCITHWIRNGLSGFPAELRFSEIFIRTPTSCCSFGCSFQWGYSVLDLLTKLILLVVSISPLVFVVHGIEGLGEVYEYYVVSLVPLGFSCVLSSRLLLLISPSWNRRAPLVDVDLIVPRVIELSFLSEFWTVLFLELLSYRRLMRIY